MANSNPEKNGYDRFDMLEALRGRLDDATILEDLTRAMSNAEGRETFAFIARMHDIPIPNPCLPCALAAFNPGARPTGRDLDKALRQARKKAPRRGAKRKSTKKKPKQVRLSDVMRKVR